MIEILQTAVQLISTFLTLIIEVGAFALRNALLIVWIAWWLCGVNWHKAWHALARGGWAVVVLLTLMTALAWSAMFPSNCEFMDTFTIGNFWWQLGAVTLLVISALLCGWLQGFFGWAPPEIDLEPPVHAAHGHGHH